jgi:hypothetical protein
MDMAAATAAVHPRASSLSHSSRFRITTLPALGSRPAASPCSPSSSSSFCSCWDGVGQQQLRVQMVGKKSGREQVGGGGIVSTFAFDAEKPILYENGGEEPPTVVSAPNRRIVAIGDLHGDLERTLWALQLAGVLSNDGLHRWTGGTTVLVQVGDVLDRGDDEIAILSLLACLSKQAHSKGGAVFQIHGNHETMNVAGDFRHVTPGGFKEAEAFVDCCEEDHGGNWEAAFGEWYTTSQERKADQKFSFGGWLPIFNPLRVLLSCSSVSMYSLFFPAHSFSSPQPPAHWLFFQQVL